MKRIVSGIAIVLMTSSTAFAFSENANENAAKGQLRAAFHCGNVIHTLNPQGDDGPDGPDNAAASSGNAGDPKTDDTHVTNCDKYWTDSGAIGPD